MQVSTRSLRHMIGLGSAMLVAAMLAACEPDARPESYQQFVARTPWIEPAGAWLVDWDILIHDEAELRALYEASLDESAADEGGVSSISQGLALHFPNNVDARWPASTASNLTYCVSNAFGSNKSQLVAALNDAAAAWESAAAVHFVHSAAQDPTSLCAPSNGAVVFDVRPISGAAFIAAAFFPNQSRGERTLWVDDQAFSLSGSTTLTGVMRHELGHVLGFRHEHTRSGLQCWEDHRWRPLTAYDVQSAMFYPRCGGLSEDFQLSDADMDGAACLYGAASGYSPDCSYRGLKYRGHSAGIGWLPWVRDRDIAGTVGQGRGLEAFRAQRVGGGTFAVCYTAHVAGFGWQSEVCNGTTAGTVGQGRSIEAIRIRLVGAPPGCGVRYQAHLAYFGWQASVANNAIAGTTGQGRAIEGLRVWLTGTCF